jgi:Tfp pilus assembly protein PilF
MTLSSHRIRTCFLIIAVALCSNAALAQGGDICREFGVTPNRDLDDNGRLASFVYGRILLAGVAPGSKAPQVTVQYSDTGQPGIRQRVGRTGNYCFRRYGSGATVIVEVDGLEAARRSISEGLGNQQREDFEIDITQKRQLAAPGVVSATSAKRPDPRTAELYDRAVTAEKEGRPEQAIEIVKDIVKIDPGDHIAWAKLGSLFQVKGSNAEAETAYKRALEIRKDYVPALMNYGVLRAVQKDFAGAIELFKQATIADPSNARSFRLLGEAYLQNRQGSLGLEALDKAINLDPEGMADSHLLKARLYDLAGMKKQAADEYRAFLKKVPKYKDKKTLETYIIENGQ